MTMKLTNELILNSLRDAIANGSFSMEGFEATEILGKVDKMIVALEKKRESAKNAPKKPSKIAQENALKAESLMEVLEAGKNYSVADVQTILNIETVGKTVPVLTLLYNEGRITRKIVKGKTVYALKEVE